MNPWNTLKADLLEERGPMCQICKLQGASELHHAIYGRMKGVKELDDERNLLLVCQKCHSNVSYATRRLAWHLNCVRYGEADMEMWHDELPLLSKENFW